MVSRKGLIATFEGPEGNGGLGRMIRLQQSALAALGWELEVVSPSSFSRQWRSRRYPGLNIALLSWQISREARRRARRGIVLFSHGTCGAAGGRGPRIQLYHGTFAALALACRARLSHAEYRILRSLTGLLEKRSGEGAVRLGVSREVAREVVELYGLPSSDVLHNAIDADHFAAARPGPAAAAAGPPAGLFVGRLEYGKGRELVRQLGARLPAGYRLEIASGDVRPEVHWPDGRSRALGAVSYEELPAVYARAGYLLNPSRYEGFGLTLIEAWAAGTPVITTNIGLIKELREREPTLDRLVVDDPDDVDAFASRIRFLADNPEVGLRQAAWGREIVRERFSRGAYHAAWKQLLAAHSL